ncbi:MAG: HEAT repeat domain-containing protein [Planctomycetes bacterium]|nr:HEAT repeat domain-containing protein [Planctomycetota bacterium]
MNSITTTVGVLIIAVASGQEAPDWGERLARLGGAEWRQAFNVGQQLADLPPDQAYDVLAAAWPTIDVKAKQQLLKAFNYAMPYPLHARMHGRILDVMHLGVTDDPDVQLWSLSYLKCIAFRDFAEDFDAYRAWYAANRVRPIKTVMAESCREYVGRLAEVEPDQQRTLASILPLVWSVFRDTPEVRQAALDAGYLDVVAAWAAHPDTDGRALGDLLSVMGYMEAGEAYLREVVLAAATRQGSLEVRSAAVRALGRPGNAWAIDPLLDLLTAPRDGADVHPALWHVAGALAAIGDPRVIPTMIAAIDADNTYDTVYGVGYFGLGKLTAVTYAESHDGPWWRQWWQKNRARFPVEVRRLEIPTLAEP